MWTNTDEDHGGAIRRLLWMSAHSVIVENEIRELTRKHEKFAQGRRMKT